MISETQNAYLPGREKGESIRHVFDFYTLSSTHKTNTILLSVDFQKCFDRIHNEAIYKCLENFGFGENICNMISVNEEDWLKV